MTGTLCAVCHQSLVAWIGCLYLMGWNLSNRRIAHALSLNEDNVQRMTEQLCTGVIASQPPLCLSGEVEYVWLVIIRLLILVAMAPGT